MKSIVQLDRPLVPPPESYKGDFIKGKTYVFTYLYYCLKSG